MDVDDLYGLPLERFVTERTALARGLRRAGNRDEAAAVAALRKPSVAAWAVNQLIRTQRQAVADLFRAGDALRQAQAEVLAGRAGAAGLRAASERERTSVDALVDAAGGLLSSGGHELGQATLDRVAETLHAAALDQDARGLVGDGRLERELRHVGLGTPGALSGARAARPEPAGPSPAGRSELAKPSRAAGESAAEVKRLARERQEARKRAAAAERQARQDVARADRTVNAAEGRRRRAVETLRQADEELARARADAQAAAEVHRQAARRLETPDIDV
jgi:hypothetical protein